MPTGSGDLVLIHHLNRPAGYARVEEILSDVKPGWWQVRLLLLQVPAKEVVWILREEYISGDEFTMGGESMRLERVIPWQEKPQPQPPESKNDAQGAQSKAKGKGNVVLLSEHKR